AAALGDAKAQAEAKQKLAAYQTLISDGRLALKGNRFDDAIQAFSEAQKILPSDQAAKDFLADAQKGKKDAAEALALATKKRLDEQKRADDLKKALADGRSALTAHDLDAAAKALGQAEKIAPDNPDVQRALKDLAQAKALAT